MPGLGAEVFTISGAFDAAACPGGWSATKKGNCAAPGGRAAPAAVALQNALRSLGQAAGDKALAATGVDGIIGPGTAAAVNRAFTVHIGAGQAAANLRSGRLTKFDVAQNASKLTQIVTAEVQRRGGSVAPASMPRVPARASTPSRMGPEEGVRPPPKPGTPSAMIPTVPAVGPPPPSTGWPWWAWVLVGTGVVGLAGGTYVLVSRSGDGGARRRPERERERESEAKRGPEPKMPKMPTAAATAGFGMALTKQHFTAIAGILCEHRVPQDLTRSFSRYFASENPRFDMARFERAVETSC